MTTPYRPLSPTAGAFGSFDLTELAEELKRDEAFAKSGRVARTIARSDALTAVLTVLAKEGEIHGHTSPGPATVTVLSGHVQLGFERTGDVVEAPEGALVVFAKDTPHRVTALEDSAFLIVIGGRHEG